MSPDPFTVLVDSGWTGFHRDYELGPDIWPAHLKQAYEDLIRKEYGDPPPSMEERAARCRQMGLILCTCTGVETEQGRKLLYSPTCEIHGRHRRAGDLRWTK